MAKWLILSAGYLWLGFTVGYFFRKWMETSYLPRLAAERDADLTQRKGESVGEEEEGP